MSKPTPVNHVSVAPLRNVQNFLKLADALITRNPNVFGIGVFFGYSGLGKTVAANYVRNKTRAHLVECQSFWSRKDFAYNLLIALSVPEPKGTISQMMSQAGRIMGDEPDRPLIIDEADYLIKRGMVDFIRDLYGISNAPIILVGEENLPQNLKQSEKTYNRILEWGMAEPCDIREITILAKLHCPDLALADDLVARIEIETSGIASRVVTTLVTIATQARNSGAKEINLNQFSGPFADGRVPTRHAARRIARAT